MASNDGLKTVGLTFKADGAVDFRKSLTDVNNAVNENRSAFKLAKSEWDKSTSSADKLRATQEYLQNQTEAYTQKVDRLTEILKAQENAQVRDEAAISKTRQQLDNAKASLNNYKSGLEDVNKKLESGAATLEDYSKKVKDFSDTTGKIGSSLTKNVTAPVAAAGTGIMAAWAQVDEQPNGKYRFYESYEDYMTGKIKYVSCTLDSNSKKKQKEAFVILQNKIEQIYANTLTQKPKNISMSKLVELYLISQKQTVKLSTYNRKEWISSCRRRALLVMHWKTCRILQGI